MQREPWAEALAGNRKDNNNDKITNAHHNNDNNENNKNDKTTKMIRIMNQHHGMIKQ